MCSRNRMRLPRPQLKTLGKSIDIKTVSKVAVGATVVGVGAAALAGQIPGLEGLLPGLTDGIGKVWNGATDGFAGLLEMGPMLAIGGGAIVLLLLLK